MTLVVAGTLLAGVSLAQVKTARNTPPPPTVPTHPAQAPARRKPAPAASPQQKTAAKKDRSGFKFHVMQEVKPTPPPPPTPAQLPATKPTVSYNNGQLSIVANNSTMTDVLNAVHSQTGAQFDMNGVSSSDRVYVKLGPGAPKDVLAALLDGSRFNYAILGSPDDPTAVEHVVLMPKTGGNGSTVAAAPQQPMPNGSRVAQQQQQQEETDEDMPPEEEQPAADEQQQQQQDQQQQQEQQQQEQQQPNGQNQVKTPEQLLQELQQMQQQQQQQQQQQNPDQQQQQPPQPPQQQQQIPDHEMPD